MVLSHLYVEGRTVPYRTPLRSPSTREADGRRRGSTAPTTAIRNRLKRGSEAPARYPTEHYEKSIPERPLRRRVGGAQAPSAGPSSLRSSQAPSLARDR